MSREKSPAFQFYPGDWLSDADVSMMSVAQQGMYFLLLCHCWLEVALPERDDQLARLARVPLRIWMSEKASILARFELQDDGYRHGRLDREREKQAAWAEKSRAGGKASCVARASKFGSSNPRTNCEPTREPAVNSSSSSSSSSAEEKIAAIAAPVSQPSKPKAPPDPRVTPFLKWFASESEAITKVPYAVEWQRDAAIVKALYKTYSDRQLRELAWSLLHTADDWHDKIGRTIPTLKRQANVLAERRTQTLALYRQSNFRDEQLGLTAEVVS